MITVPRSKERADALRDFIEAAIKVYNRYRGAESRAKLVKLVGDVAFVVFEGSFCETCGINDWVDDLRYVIEDLGGEAELLSIVESEDFYSYRIGVFKLKKVPDRKELEEKLRDLLPSEDV